MTAQRWNQIQTMFWEAVALPKEQRPSFLAQACETDPQLRLEIEQLLESDSGAQNTLHEAVAGAADWLVTSSSAPKPDTYAGRRIGPYQLIRPIGSGGMGTVYRAIRADDQYLRAVAIKLIRHGGDTPESLSRFRMERQILATLQHPNIAALLDGGTTEEGQPYLVMEYIEGEPLIQFCRSHKLGVEQRVELFRSLCSAIHYAHQSLVIHRDIKPSNILVGADGVPKLLDFGIAKLMSPELMAGEEWQTRTLQRLLTPDYGSPEQVRGEPLTTATDIYSLGILLYELLSEKKPYRNATTAQEICRAVCEVDPPRLSEAVDDDPRLRRQLAGDLENIVAKAIRKEPQRRYASAQELSEDLQRYLRGLPVAARPDTLFYRVSKLIGRNRLSTVAFAMLALSVFLGWASTISQARRTERRFEEVRRLAKTVLFDFQAKIAPLPGSMAARESLVQTGLQYLNSLSADAQDDPTLAWELAQAYDQVGDIQGNPTGPNLGQHKQALESYRKALALASRVARKQTDWRTLRFLADLNYKTGDLELRQSGPQRAITWFESGLSIAERAAGLFKSADSDDLLRDGYERLANARLRSTQIQQALRDIQAAVAAAERAAERRPGGITSETLAHTWVASGNILWLTGDLQTAASRYEKAIATLELLYTAQPENLETAAELGRAYRRLADLLANPSHFHFSQPERAMPLLEKSLAIAHRLQAREPESAPARTEIAVILRRMGAALRGSDPVKSAEYYRQAIEIAEALHNTQKQDFNYLRDLANSRLGLGIALHNQRQIVAAHDQLAAALKIQNSLADASPDRVELREDTFDTYLALGQVLLDARNFPAAGRMLKLAMDSAEGLVSRGNGSLYAERCLAFASEAMGRYELALSNTPGASAWYNKALGIWRRWRGAKLAVPYSADRERELLEAMRKNKIAAI